LNAALMMNSIHAASNGLGHGPASSSLVRCIQMGTQNLRTVSTKQLEDQQNHSDNFSMALMRGPKVRLLKSWFKYMMYGFFLPSSLDTTIHINYSLQASRRQHAGSIETIFPAHWPWYRSMPGHSHFKQHSSKWNLACSIKRRFWNIPMA
jgi:hypothetical protein